MDLISKGLKSLMIIRFYSLHLAPLALKFTAFVYPAAEVRSWCRVLALGREAVTN